MVEWNTPFMRIYPDVWQERTREQHVAHQERHQRRLWIDHVHHSASAVRSAKDRSRLWKVGVRDLVRDICCALYHVGLSRVPGWPAPRHFYETCQSSEQKKWTEV